jgi:CDP-glucose 4,6-dehydratase
MRSAMLAAEPEVVFHLAAQSLVRPSYQEPLKTLADNVMGTANVLECMRSVPSVRAAVIVTTDKCYQNNEWVYPYREQDPLGGNDVYSASKACAEIVTHAYRRSFFGADDNTCRIASVRAGNVFGGGDWALDRLVPDCIRAFARGESVRLRYPHAVRPWQHVFEPLNGYLLLAERLLGEDGEDYCEGWNFGPDPSGEATVYQMTDAIARGWGNGATVESETDVPRLKEAKLLRLDSTKARVGLDWRPRWGFERAVEETVAWYRAWSQGGDMRDFSSVQIESYFG